MLVASGAPLATQVDLGDSTPMRLPQYYASGGLQLLSKYAAYGELYKSQPWVYTLVRKLATSASRLPIKVYERVDDTDRAEARDTPYGQLIRMPNPKLGAKLLWNWVFSTQELYGEAMLLKLRDDTGRVRELWPMHPSNVLVRVIDGETQYGYMTFGSAQTGLTVFKAANVVHFRGYNPDTTSRGVSPCEPLRQTLLAEDAMRRGSVALWNNGARPSMVLTHSGKLSKDALDRLLAQWNDRHTGVDSWGKTAILEEGMTAAPLQLSAEEMQWLQGRQLNREECCAVWDVPPPAVQILDRATFSNITEQMRSLYRETMAPRLEAAEDVLATQLAPDFNPAGDLYAEWLMDEVLRASYEVRVAAYAQAIGTGQMQPAEARAKENLPFVEGSDQLVVNAALIPLKTAVAVSPGTGADVELAPQKIKSLSAKDADKIDRRLSKVDAVDDIDTVALLENLDVGAAEVIGLVKAAQLRGVPVTVLRSWIAASAIEVTAEEPAA